MSGVGNEQGSEVNHESVNTEKAGGARDERKQGAAATMGQSDKNKKPTKSKPSRALLEARLRAQKQQQSRRDDSDFTVILPKDHLEAARESKDVVRKQTGVVYDERLMEHKCLWDDEFPESPERFSAVVERCKELGLLDRCTSLTPRFASDEELLQIHTPEHIEKLRSISENGRSNLDSLEDDSALYDSVYFHPSTSDVSRLAAGCTIELVSAILDGKVGNGMALVRPPGHHAMEGEFCGYSFLNNVAIATKLALNSGNVKRILIVDFDVHHGQGTQQAFYNDPRVLYFSTHRYENGTFWPHLEESDFNYIGDSAGRGFNVNVPLNTTGLGNSDFLSIWHNILLPIAYEFNPELVLVSAGFDSALGDEKGEMELEPRCYPHLIWPLLGLANGKLGVVLEGGYCLQSLAEGAALTLRCLLRDACPLIEPTNAANTILASTVLNSAYMLQQQWVNLSSVRFSSREEIEQEEEDEDQKYSSVHWPKISYDWKVPRPERFETRNCYPLQAKEAKQRTKKMLDRLIQGTSLSLAKNNVCLVYNEVMLKHQSLSGGGHPEKPERISNIFNLHRDYGLLDRVQILDGRKATEEELMLVHSEEHIRQMRLLQNLSSEELEKLHEKYISVYLHRDSYESAVFSAGSVLQVTENVLKGASQAGVAIVRPPGHHAEKGEACGFCLFNNVAVAAKYAVQKFNLKRVLIVDWDVHHGNGIQRAFEDDPRVLYISIHRYDNGSFFPSSEEADYKFIGTDAGKGFTVNIPWNGSGMGDTEYIAAFAKVILPIAYQFAPELVFVSAGFDAAKGDPLGGCKVTPECYGHMTHLLSSLANGRIILALEGGYNLSSISFSMVMCTKALLGDPLPPLDLNKEILPSARTSIRNTLEAHAPYWPAVKPFLKVVPTFDEALIPHGKYIRTTETNLKTLSLN